MVAQAHAVAVVDLAGLLLQVITRIEHQEKELDRALKAHPDAEIYLSLPGLATSAPGYWPSSATIRTATKIVGRGRTTPAPRQSPRRRGAREWCWPGSFATSGWRTSASCGPSRPSRPRRAPAATTTSNGPGRRATRRRCADLGQPSGRHPPRLPASPRAVPGGRRLADTGGRCGIDRSRLRLLRWCRFPTGPSLTPSCRVAGSLAQSRWRTPTAPARQFPPPIPAEPLGNWRTFTAVSSPVAWPSKPPPRRTRRWHGPARPTRTPRTSSRSDQTPGSSRRLTTRPRSSSRNRTTRLKPRSPRSRSRGPAVPLSNGSS